MPVADVEVAVVGPGAIGCLVAAELAAAGHDVVLCARDGFDRLVVERDRDPRDLPVTTDGPVRVVCDPADVGPTPWVVVALKAPASDAAGPWLERLVGEGTVVLGLQNGVEHRERLDPHLRGAPLVRALAVTGVERLAPGRVAHHAGDRLTIEDGEEGRAFGRLLDGSHLQIDLEDDFRTAAWRKLLSNAGANPITTLTDRRAPVLREHGIRELAHGLLLEVVAVARAEGAGLSDRDAADTVESQAQQPDENGSSMLFDRRAGRPLETDAMNGAVVRIAGRHDIEVPLNRAVAALLDGLDGGRGGR